LCYLGCNRLGLRDSCGRRCRLTRVARGHKMRHNEESDERHCGNRPDSDSCQPWLLRCLFYRSRYGGGRRSGRFRAGAPFGFGARSKSALRGLLGGIRLHFSAHPLARTACVERGQATIEIIDLAELVLGGGLFAHVFSLRSSCSFSLARCKRRWTVSTVLCVISAMSPTLNWPSICNR